MKARLVLTVALVPLLLGTAGAGARTSQQQPQTRPNILVIETDDQTLAELEVLERTQALIGAEGATFDNHFDSFALCCPSRASFLTGQYPHNNGVRGNQLPDGGYYKLNSKNTLAVWLQRSGYYTAHLGKYLNGYGTRNPREIPPGWSEWRGAVDPTAYRYYGYRLNENGRVSMYCADAQQACYQTDVYRDKASDIVRRRAVRTQPFFLWVAFLANHGGGPRDPDDPPRLGTPMPALRHQDTFAEEPLPTPPSFNEADVSDKPATIRRRRLLSDIEIAAIREAWQQRRETLLSVDEAVESIVNTLAATGELEKTLIVFTSDNGFFHGEHRIPNGKVILYEPSIRVPLLIRGPGVPKGVRRTQLTSNVDLAPTILDAANVKPGRVQDGISLLPLAADATRELGRDLLVDNSPGPAHWDAIRTRNFKYAEYQNGDKELYDLARDPHELESRHEDPQYRQVREALAERLHTLVGCTGAACRQAPEINLAAACTGGSLRASLTGEDVLGVEFYVDGRRIANDTTRPFQLALAASRVPARALVRARASVAFDRLVSRDRVVTGC